MRQENVEIEIWAVQIALIMLVLAPWPYFGHTVWGYSLLCVLALIPLWHFRGREEFKKKYDFSTYVWDEYKADWRWKNCWLEKSATKMTVMWHFYVFFHPSLAQLWRMIEWHNKWKKCCKVFKHFHLLVLLKFIMYCDVYTVLEATTSIRYVITWWFEGIDWFTKPVTTYVKKETWDCYGWWMMLVFLIAIADYLYYQWYYEVRTSSRTNYDIVLEIRGFGSSLDRLSDRPGKVVFLLIFVAWPLEVLFIIMLWICWHCTIADNPQFAEKHAVRRQYWGILLINFVVLCCKFKFHQSLQSDFVTSCLDWIVAHISSFQ